MNINYNVLPTFAKVHRDRNPFLFVMGPVGSGKSSGCIFQALFNAMRQKPDEHGVRHSRHLVVRATYPALKSTTIKTWISWFKDKITMVYDIPIIGKIKYDLDDGTSVNMEVIFLAVDNDKSAEKLRSLEVTSAHLNEASELTEGTYQLVSTRTNRFPAEKDGGAVNPFIILDYNSVSTEHWLYKLAEEKKPAGHSFYRQPPAVLKVDGKYILNPEAENVKNLGNNYYENICACADDDFIHVNLMNNYGEVKRGKPVYKDYLDLEHHIDEDFKPLRGIPVVVGLDQGLTPSAVFTQQLPDGTVVVFDELCTDNCSLKEMAEDFLWPKITSEYPWIINNFRCVCDPATGQRSMNDAKSGMDILRSCNLPVTFAKTNNWTPRFESVSQFLRLRGKFKLGPKCINLRKGFVSEYKYAETKTINGIMYKASPVKNEYSHVHDALQYAMMEYVHKKERKFAFNKSGRGSVFDARHRVASSIGGY